MTRAEQTLLVYNPLPVTLAHYGAAVAREVAGCVDLRTWSMAPRTGIQSRKCAGRAIKTVAYLRDLAWLYRRRKSIGHLLILWPVFGYIDVLIFSRLFAKFARCAVVIHDPRPLRKQLGHGGRWSRALARVLGKHSAVLLTHSAAARDQLLLDGWRRVAYVPLPLALSSVASDRPAGGFSDAGLLVFGQYKPVRAIHQLVAVGSSPLLADIRKSIVGRGWPEIPGWDVSDGFVDEAEVDRLLRAAGAVVLPYERYWQSEVLLRAVAVGTPVLASHHPQVVEVFGANYPGILREWTPEEVQRALDATSVVDVAAVADGYQRYASGLWQAWLREFLRCG